MQEETIGDKKHLEQLNTSSKPVAITLPPYYGCAWIIDGQHRLYGYADVEEKNTETLPVIAFVDVDQQHRKLGKKESLEAKIFVDINKNQKSIPANLLWDLYEDLYPESTDESEILLYAISMIAKKLNSDKASPFFGHIEVPKEQNDGNLTLYAVCNSIKQQKLISKDEGLLFRESYENTIDFAYERIAEFFEVFKQTLPNEWKMGDKHYLRTNAGDLPPIFVPLTKLVQVVECGHRSQLELGGDNPVRCVV